MTIKEAILAMPVKKAAALAASPIGVKFHGFK